MPPVTDADRVAAFPDVDVSAVHDTVNYFVLFDQLEWQGDGSTGGMNWDSKGWIGGDRDRLWFRTEGAAESGSLGDAEAHLVYGRAVARWWDVLVGLRQDLLLDGPGKVVAGARRPGVGPVLVRRGGDRLPWCWRPDGGSIRGRVRTAVHQPAGPPATRRAQPVWKDRRGTQSWCGR